MCGKAHAAQIKMRGLFGWAQFEVWLHSTQHRVRAFRTPCAWSLLLGFGSQSKVIERLKLGKVISAQQEPSVLFLKLLKIGIEIHHIHCSIPRHTQAHTYTCMHTITSTHVHTHVHSHNHKHACTHACSILQAHTQVHTHAQFYKHTRR